LAPLPAANCAACCGVRSRSALVTMRAPCQTGTSSASRAISVGGGAAGVAAAAHPRQPAARRTSHARFI